MAEEMKSEIRNSKCESISKSEREANGCPVCLLSIFPRLFRISIFVFRICLALYVSIALADDPTRSVALELVREGDARSAAIEFRRLALGEADAGAQASFYWHAGHQYLQAGDYASADRMIDRAEDVQPDLGPVALVLRAETAAKDRRIGEAIFYWESVLNSAAPEEARALAARRLSALRLRDGDLDGARQALLRAPEPHPDGERALDRYASGRDKSPRLGGFLGIAPGLGYAYAGEYANALRSLILNALFIYGMVDTAQNDHWGGFAVITFFEITWYTGSIYGGIDASHRYNQRRIDEAVDCIEGAAFFEPRWEQVPAISLRFLF